MREMLLLEFKRHVKSPSNNFQLRFHRTRRKQGNQHGLPDRRGVKQRHAELQVFSTAPSITGKLEYPPEATGS